MPNRNQKPISKAMLLVFPLYTFTGNRTELSIREKRNINFVLGLWGKEIQKIQKENNAIAIIVFPRYPYADKYSQQKMRRFFEFGEKLLGDRLIPNPGPIKPNLLNLVLENRGFIIDRKSFQGTSFGEHIGVNACVGIQTENFCKALGIDPIKMRQVPELSVPPEALKSQYMKRRPIPKPKGSKRLIIFRGRKRL